MKKVMLIMAAVVFTSMVFTSCDKKEESKDGDKTEEGKDGGKEEGK
jgi:hypothetical protein